MNRHSFLLFPLLSLGLPILSLAKEEAKVLAAKLDEFKLGALVTGDQADLDGMKGKVVVMEFWGTKCGPCMAAMPSFVDMDKRQGNKGVQVVGVHCQHSDLDEVKKTVEKVKIKFPVVNNSSVPSALKFEGIPHTFVFSAAGNLVYSGHPGDEMEKVVRKEMKNLDPAASSAKPAAPSNISPARPAPPAAANADPVIPNRAWASADGKIMNAALLSVDGENGKFKSPKGQVFSLPLNKLSDADQDYIRKNTAK
jgi:thiol-disulfide isomerase/thioredoxin